MYCLVAIREKIAVIYLKTSPIAPRVVVADDAVITHRIRGALRRVRVLVCVCV